MAADPLVLVTRNCVQHARMGLVVPATEWSGHVHAQLTSGVRYHMIAGHCAEDSNPPDVSNRCGLGCDGPWTVLMGVMLEDEISPVVSVMDS